jgi:DNA polymerase
VKCRPPKNRNPYPSESNTCVSAYLVEEIARLDPPLILAMGNVAMDALFDVQGVTQYRGVWIPLPREEGMSDVLITYHPAYVGYQGGLDSEIGKVFQGDLEKFASRCIALGAVLDGERSSDLLRGQERSFNW